MADSGLAGTCSWMKQSAQELIGKSGCCLANSFILRRHATTESLAGIAHDPEGATAIAAVKPRRVAL
jgi:hypothetical protein